MNANYLFSLILVVVLALVAYFGAMIPGGRTLFGILIPYAAFIIFILGFSMRIKKWASCAVPFRIPTTCGQQKSLPWIEQNKIDNPSTKLGVVVRMALEILCFRSLFRNTKMKLKDGKLSYSWEIFLWVFALVFHYSFLVVLLRHLRFFTNPIPYPIQLIETVDSFFRIEIMQPFLQIGLPAIYLSGFGLLVAAAFLFARRIVIPQIRYISLFSDFFPLFLIMGIALTGILMRYFTKTDIVGVKELTMGLANLHYRIPETVGNLFFVHLFLVSILFAYFPLSKLMHLGGIFLSPTRNLTTNTREIRHVNPWNYPVKVHTYDEYEEEFREKMIEAGLPVEKE